MREAIVYKVNWPAFSPLREPTQGCAPRNTLLTGSFLGWFAAFHSQLLSSRSRMLSGSK